MKCLTKSLTDKQSNDCECQPKPSEISDTQILYWATSILENKFKRSNYLTSPDCSRNFLKVFFADKSHEEFAMVFLDNQNAVIGFKVLFQGTIDGAAVYPREIVKATLEHQAAAVLLTHNHPSGSAEPSEADKHITRRIITALETIDVRVIDHLIVAGTEMVSFAERGLL